MTHENIYPAQSIQTTRRTFLGGIGAAAITIGAGRALPTWARPPASTSFTRIFNNLPPFAESSAKLTAALLDIGKPGGIMDAKDNLAAGPILLITDPALSANNQNAAMPNGVAGTTFMGQFIDHDMTFDTTSRLGVPTKPRLSPNSRAPSLDLDSVYGDGPIADPLLYDPADRIKFKVESGGLFEDLPRTAEGRAIIADPRNDEHVILAGLQAAFLMFHNRAVDYVRATGENDSSRVFARARQLTTWHYQWIVLHEVLPSFIGQAMVNDILTRKPRFYRVDDEDRAAMPVEFQGAAYRFGHSMVRPSYRANLKGDNGNPFFGLIFDPKAQGQADPIDLRGGSRARRRFVGWQTFFDFRDGEVKPRKTIDTRISTPLFNLPLGAIADGSTPTSLPQRNLLRQVTWQLPSGQRIAQEIGAPSLAARDLSELAAYDIGLDRHTPLWYYVLKEAEIIGGGQNLGPVGGRIVGEVMIGLLQADRDSFLSESLSGAPRWTPTLPSSSGAGNFRMVDFLTFAGVSPASRGQ
jgi:Animal haem peroxidase